MALPAGSSSFTYRWTYDVFLSFRGEDTRLGFVGHLYESLRQKGIYAFLDDESLKTGEEIRPSLLNAIQESRIAIIVFSEKYASSTFCLDELAKILECFKAEGRLVYPVFYHVDPSDVRHQRGSYGEALANLLQGFENNEEKLQKWRLALSEAADLSGWHLKPGIAREQEYIGRITCEVSARINRTPLYVTNYPVGLVSRVQEVISLLDLWSNGEVTMVGILGTGGIGKSTIARGVYNSIADHFEGLCFLSDVREISNKHGLSHLQETLLCELVREKDLKLGDLFKGISIIAHRLHRKKILLILDDVDKLEQLCALAGNRDWFGSGSRIIITTRNKQLLVSHGIERIYDVKELNDEEALQLLSWKAFKKDNVDSGYMDVSNHAVLYSGGLPLALEVIGSNLCGKRVDEWSSALDKYKRIPNKKVLEVLKLSYDALEEEEKEIFLDLACFFKGEKLGYVKHMLLSMRGIQIEDTIGVLIDKSLIKIKENHVTMHDLIEDMGKEIVRQQSPREPGRRDRLWFYEDILHVLQENKGTNKIEVIILDLPEDKEILWSGEAFREMKNLKMLVIKNACSSIGPKYLPSSLRVLEWKGYPFEFLPSNFHPTKLVHLNLSNSCCALLQPFNEKFESLSCMNFKNCKFLRQIPDLSRVSNLTKLWLDDCTNLIEIHDSVGFLDKLRELSAMRCKNLRTMPPDIKLTSLEHLNLFGCSSLQSFPEILGKMEKMRTLDLDRTAIAELPSSICNLIGLEILNMDECHYLKQLPTSICMLPNLWLLRANFCEGMKYFKVCEGGEQASSDRSAMSLKLTYFYFSNCNLSDDSLASCLSYFPNMIHLDLSFNKFTTLPACIKECHHLRYLLLDNCKQLKHIVGMPPNLEKFSAICCTSLTKSSKSKILNQAFYQRSRTRNFIFPGKKIPERLDKYSQGTSVSFWVREEFPTIFLWILVKDDQDSLCNCIFSVHINDTRLSISSGWLSLSTIKTDHIYVCDLQSMVREIELPQVNRWNHIKVSIANSTREMKSERKIYFAIHVYKQENNIDNIRFEDPKTFPDCCPWKKIQQPQDWDEPEDDVNWDEPEDDMDWDSNSMKYAESTKNTMSYQDWDEPEDDVNWDEPEDDMDWDSNSMKYAESTKNTMSYQDFPPGFGFYPTEEELVAFYLRNKLGGQRNDHINRVIPVIDIYDVEPWQLPKLAGELCRGDKEQWFFFSTRQEREARGARPKRTPTSGYWKATGSPGHVYSSDNRVIGVKRTMVFYKGEAPSGMKTRWKMNEYRTIEVSHLSSIATPKFTITEDHMNGDSNSTKSAESTENTMSYQGKGANQTNLACAMERATGLSLHRVYLVSCPSLFNKSLACKYYGFNRRIIKDANITEEDGDDGEPNPKRRKLRLELLKYLCPQNCYGT